jgi:hypothetical protein
MKRVLLALVLAVPMFGQTQPNTITASDGVVSISITKAATLPGLAGGAMWINVTPKTPAAADVGSWEVVVVYRDASDRLHTESTVAVCFWGLGPIPISYPAEGFIGTTGAVTVISASARPRHAEHTVTF